MKKDHELRLMANLGNRHCLKMFLQELGGSVVFSLHQAMPTNMGNIMRLLKPIPGI